MLIFQRNFSPAHLSQIKKRKKNTGRIHNLLSNKRGEMSLQLPLRYIHRNFTFFVLQSFLYSLSMNFLYWYGG